MKKYLSLSETLKKGVPIRSSLASRESRPLNNNNEIFVFATCGRKLYRHHVGYEQHTKFTCSYSPYKWGSRQPFRNQTTTTKPIAKCKQTDSGSGCKDFNALKVVEVINTRQSYTNITSVRGNFEVYPFKTKML